MNGEKTLPKSLQTLSTYLTVNDEVIVVVNGSTDGSLELLEETAHSWKKQPGLPDLVVETSGQGLGLALLRGIESSRGEFLILSADDLPFGISDWEAASNLEQPAHLIIGSKGHHLSVVNRTISRRIVTSIFGVLRRLVLGTRIQDTQGTFLVNGNWIREFLGESTENGFMWTTHLTIFAEKNGLSVREVPVVLTETHGSHGTRVKISDLIDGVYGLFRVRSSVKSAVKRKNNLAITYPVNKPFPPPQEVLLT
jgi:glycosyltransferase involved in cell wall biosynthesis